MATVEIQTPTLTGSLDADFVNLSGNGQPNIVRSTEAMSIDARWYIDGSLAPSLAMNGRDSQVYDVTVTLNYHDVNGNPGPMAAFVALGKLQVHA